MPRILLCLLFFPLVASGQCRFKNAGRSDTVTYRFSIASGQSTPLLRVRLEFRMGPNQVETFSLPNSWAGETLQAAQNFKAVSKATSLEPDADGSTMSVHAPAGQLIVLEYDLQKDWTGPLVNPLQFHPLVFSEYVEFTGSNALIQRRLPDEATATANFDWQSLPDNWTLATSFGTSTSNKHRCQAFTGPWRRVDQALFAAGDYRIHEFRINGQPAFLAIRGAWVFTDDQAMQDISRVVGNVRDFWHDNQFPYFLVTVSPYDRDHGSADGSAFTNAFWMFVSRQDRLNGLLPVLAHESFHAWDPGKMGTVPQGYDENLIKWFREGPTEYYAQLLTYRAGELSAADYIRSLNKALLRFPNTNDEYVRGQVISLWLDGTIRKESSDKQSLDSVMFDLVRQRDQPFTLARLFQSIDPYLSPASQALLRKAVLEHGNLPAPAEPPVLSDCAHAALGNYPTFDLGFDTDASRKANMVSGVVEGGPAFAAGLRNGQKLLHISFNNHDPDYLATFIVNEGLRISYYPKGAPVEAWQYSLDAAKTCAGVAAVTAVQTTSK